MTRFGIGASVLRKEDARLLTGDGRFVEDVSLPGTCHGFVLRSPHAHADIQAIDADRAKSASGVLLVVTADDYLQAGLGTLPYVTPHAPGWDLSNLHIVPRLPLAGDRVRFVGDAIAFIVAETLFQARDAAELIEVKYAIRPAVVGTDEAAGPGAPQLWDDCPRNVMFVHEKGDREQTDQAFAAAAHVVSERLLISRVAPNPIENRAILSHHDEANRLTTVHATGQSAFQLRRCLAQDIFGTMEDRFRVVIEDVGGSFGVKHPVYPEYALTVWASHLLCRPVRWGCERSEALLCDTHGRDNITAAELALDADGRFLAIRVATTANLGAYPALMPTGPATSHVAGVVGAYMIPAAHVTVTGVYSNTSPVSSYRGAGRPEATFVVERLVENAARQLGVDRADLRRRNLIPTEAMPYRTPFYFKFEGETFGHFEFDCGAFATVLDKAVAESDYAGFEARRATARRKGRLRGLGMAYLIEMAASPGMEFVELSVGCTGAVTVFAGTTNGGQGHHTLYTQLVCDALGVTPDQVDVVESDTGRVRFGSGTSSSRTSTMGGSAVVLAAEGIIEQGRVLAAKLLGCATVDVGYVDGSFSGHGMSVSLSEVARAGNGLHHEGTYRSRSANWPNGCHICEVEIDPDTGEVAVVGYTVAEDVGTVINPMMLAGQVHGGVLQGMAQVLSEEFVYDRRSGQAVTGSFMDYAMPHARDTKAPIRIVHHPVETKTNPLGVKGGGESGTIGSLACVMNAVVDALAPLGINDIDMPATPETVWRAIREAATRGGRLFSP